MPLIVLSVVFQVAFVLHVLKTGRNTYWIWLLIMLPLVGSICYFIIEILPGLLAGGSTRTLQKKTTDLLNPDKDIKSATRNYSIVGTVDNARKLAQQHIQKDQYEDAENLCRQWLSGLYEYDPALLGILATSQFHLGKYRECKDTLDTLIRKNPDYRDPDAHLLYARSLEELDETEAALAEYAAIIEINAIPETVLHYGELLQQEGKTDTAMALYRKTLDDAELAPAFFRNQHKYTLGKIREKLS
ncbi:MAG: tetratricopeptide repeat protein, partial [Gammaproteobacteria bacterium]|nr:tetratricopeptide repeat protein [Gammaproteobacteria bacterium]